MTTASPGQEVWIGLAQVRHRPGSGVLLDRNGAFTNALAYASNEAEYRDRIEQYLRGIGFDLVAIEDAEPLSKRVNEYEVATELLDLGREVEVTGGPRIGTLHTWIAGE